MRLCDPHQPQKGCLHVSQLRPCFCCVLQEVPYETRVQPISFKQLRSGDWRIEQDVLVPSEEVGCNV